MEYIKEIDEINFSKQEVKDYVENNIEETEALEVFLKDVESDIKFTLNNRDSSLKNEIDNLLSKDFIYIKNKDVLFNVKLGILMPNLNTYEFNNIGNNENNFKFGEYFGKLININKEEIEHIYNNNNNLLNRYLKIDIKIFNQLKREKYEERSDYFNIFFSEYKYKS